MSRQIISLNDNQWQFGQAPRRAYTAMDVYDLAAVDAWLPAAVPGNVRTDLLALERIPEPFFGEGYKESLWVERVDWWYHRRLDLGRLQPGQRAFLVFEGIDYLSAIFVNGRERSRHEGMFSRQIIEVTNELYVGEAGLEIGVRLWGSGALPKRRLNRLQRLWQQVAEPLYGSWVGVYPDRSATLKCQMSFGWDFAPPIRTMGIWDEVWLAVTGPVFIAEARASGLPLESPAQKGDRREVPAEILLQLALDNHYSGPVEAAVSISPANFSGPAAGPFLFPLHLPLGRSDLTLRCHLPEAALWQPWDRGQPHLYQVTVMLRDPEGKVLDQAMVRTGVRSVAVQQWQFSLNGQAEFIRGLNWVPADSFPGRLRDEHYANLLKLARDGGANLLRVWGGGLREKRAFYDLCDALGLLVWQEFPFACLFLGAYPRDPVYLARVKAEAGAIVRQLSSHPCLALWCGGNEFSRQRNRPLLKTLAEAVRQYNPTIPFSPVSPSYSDGGDAHNWDVWHGEAPIRAYQAESARFLSEFGLQALPYPDTLAAALPDPTDLQSWPSHYADLPKLTRYAALFSHLSPTLQQPAPPPHSSQASQISNYQLPITNYQLLITNPSTALRTTLPSFIFASQQAQAAALQTAIEHMRRRKGEAGGLCLWQFNEPWPAISWAIVDYFGRPKLAYERLWQWYNPILISLKFPVGQPWRAGDTFRAEIWVINDYLYPFEGCELQIMLDSQLIHSQKVTLPANSARPVGIISQTLAAAPQTASLTLRRGPETLAANRYDLSWSDLSQGNLYRQFRRRVAEWVMR